jgi:hypothetical protein
MDQSDQSDQRNQRNQRNQRESPNSKNPGNKLLIRVQNVRGEKENSANNVKIKGYSPNKERT